MDYNDSEHSLVLEGMYKAVEEQIEDVRDTVSRELQFSAVQNLSAYEALTKCVQEGVDSVLTELRYVSQQNCAIFENEDGNRTAMRNELLTAFNARAEQMEQFCAEQMAQTLAQINGKFEEQIQIMRNEFISALQNIQIQPAAIEVDYDRLADKVVVGVDYDRIAEKIQVEVKSEELAQKVAELLDYGKIAEKLAEGEEEKRKALADDAAHRTLEEYLANQPVKSETEEPKEERSERTESVLSDEALDYDVLAEKISTILPETDYDMIAEKVAAALPDVDADAIADKVVAALPQTDETALVDRLAEAVPPTDYDLIAERVASMLENEFDVTVDETGIEKISRAVVEQLDYGRIAECLAAYVPEKAEEPALAEEAPAEEPAAEEDTEAVAQAEEERRALDCETIAARVAEILRDDETVYEKISERFAELDRDIGLDYDKIAQQLSERGVYVGSNADEVTGVIRTDDYDDLSRASAERHVYIDNSVNNVVPERPREELDYDKIAQCLAERSVGIVDGENKEAPASVTAEDLDYDKIAQYLADKGVGIVNGESAVNAEDLDYDKIAQYLADKGVGIVNGEGATVNAEDLDYDKIAQYLAERGVVVNNGEGATVNADDLDYDRIAQNLADKGVGVNSAEEVDYEKIASRVAEILREDEESYERIASRVAELLQQKDDKDDLGRIASALLPSLTERVREQSSLVAEEPAEEPEPVKTPEPAPRPEDEAEEELAVARAAKQPKIIYEQEEEEDPEPIVIKVPAAKKPKKIVLPEEKEPEMVLRSKRSFLAKIAQSDDETKLCYSELKNVFLSYQKVNSQVNWSNDRFSYGKETIAKLAIRGKSLCAYLALNPDEFPENVYHQKFAGDTKMYEMTPMMIKVKSSVALKRAIRLIELLMERFGAVKFDEPEKVDYAAMYPYMTDEELLESGLLKTALVEKVDLDFKET